MKTEHEKYMRRALELAANARGRTSPNPMVGAVLIRDGEIVGEGWHHGPGLPHAEVEALRAAGAAAHGATLYVNLEPCSHFGRTPPCAPAVAEAGIEKVVCGMTDPNPVVSGRGFDILREGGVEVVEGVLEAECRALNAGFIKAMTKGLPYVLLKSAMTLDGKTATYTGDSRWISSAESREMVHRLRGEYDAVIVGGNTLLKDDPSLTSRVPEDVKIKDPLRVGFDEWLSISTDSNFVKLASDGKTLLVAVESAPISSEAELTKLGCRIVRVPAGPDGMPDPTEALKKIVEAGAHYVMIEGGGTLNYSFVQAGLVDRVMIFIAPKLTGGRDAITFLEGAGFPLISDGVELGPMQVRFHGPDIVVEADVLRKG